MIILPLFIAIIVGAIVAQIFLSKTTSRLPGLILPCLSLLFSLLMIVNIGAFNVVQTSSTSYDEDGLIIERETIKSDKELIVPVREMIAQIVMVFLMTNIPTVIFLIIYRAVRMDKKKGDGGSSGNNELDQMKLQDL